MEHEATAEAADWALADEAGLVDRARRREASAWTEIYESSYPTIYRYIRARIFDPATAEDLAASVFVAAIENIPSYRYRGRPLLAWLFGIAHNVVASHQRRLLKGPDHRGILRRLTGRRDGGSTETVSLEPVDPSTLQGEAGLASLADQIDLRDALARLNEAQRDVITLRFFAGFNAKEIARLLGKEPAAVYSLQSRALMTLRAQFDAAGYQDGALPTKTVPLER